MENASRAFLDAVRKSMRQIRSAIGATTMNPELLADQTDCPSTGSQPATCTADHSGCPDAQLPGQKNGNIKAGGPPSMQLVWTTWLMNVNVTRWWYLGGASMATIERNSHESDLVHDFAWHRTHRARNGGQLIDIVMLTGWAVLIGWVFLRQ
jgi:hypothetical protein